MSTLKDNAMLSHDEFLAVVLGEDNLGNSAAFAAALLGEDRTRDSAAFAAALLGEGSPNKPRRNRAGSTSGISYDDWFNAVLYGAPEPAAALREYNFDPNQPRDEIGRWTMVGAQDTSSASAPPDGTKENGYNGLGTWSFTSEEEAKNLFEDLLKPRENNFPEGWLKLLKYGCKSLTLLRTGWVGEALANPIFLEGAHFFASRASAEAKLAALSAANPDKTFILFAAQLPTRGNGARIAQSLGDGPIDLLRMTGKLNLDLGRNADFNFCTWFPTRLGKGYWEYMNHHWLRFDPGDPPAVKHRRHLPDLGKEFLILYVVVEKHTWRR